MKKLILTDQDSFTEIRRLGGVYVDKTKEIYDCIGKESKYFFLSRPRRFGKSLLCSTLKAMFSGNRELFKGLWLDSSDWSWEKHPVIYLDMTLVAGNNASAAMAEKKLCTELHCIAQNYDVELIQDPDAASLLTALIRTLNKKYNTGVVVIIDEYDKPVLDLVSEPAMRDAVHKLLSNFYAPLKALKDHLRFVFLTGVYKFSKTSIFSKLNNLNDLTFDPKAATLVGYSQEEIESYFSYEIDVLAVKEKLDRCAMLEKLRKNFNGYRFGIDVSSGELSSGVYNPFAMNHTFAANQMVEKWFESGSPTFLIKKIAEGNFTDIGPEGLDVDFGALKNSYDPDTITATSLLYYAGYATMQEFDTHTRYVRLGYPNSEIAEATSKELYAIFVGRPALTPTHKIALKIADCLQNHQLENLKDLFNQALVQLTYKIILSHEKYFQTVILLMMNMTRLRANAEIPTNDGSMDIVVETRNEIFIIELKFNKPAAQGLQQIKNKNYAKKFKIQGLPITAIGLSISLEKDAATHKCVADVAIEQL